MNRAEYEQATAATRPQRIQWWQDARFGMFIHWGLYSQLGRHEWVMNREHIPIPEYERLADTWKPLARPARAWAKLAKEAGMKYMVMTTKHHEGFCLWDTKQTDYNAVKRGPGRDLVAEYVDACHEFGLRVGFYYSLMDWHNPDGSVHEPYSDAHKRFLDFTQGCVRELCSNYGKLDILWYDVPWPGPNPEWWDSVAMNSMARELQPDLIINNRSLLDEDLGTPEERISPEAEGRNWEACMTFNGSWGYMPSAIDWRPVREVVEMLRTTASARGNLLLNVGPRPDGTLPPEAAERLIPVGQWLALNGEAVYGQMGRTGGLLHGMPCGDWTRKGNTAYFWARNWPGKELAFGGFRSRLAKASYLATGEPIAFEQQEHRLILKGLPEKNPDTIAGVCVIKLEFDAAIQQVLGLGYVEV